MRRHRHWLASVGTLVGSLAGLGFVTQACLRGPGVDAPGPDRIVASLTLFEDDVEVAQVDIDCPTEEPQGFTSEIEFRDWGCNLVEQPLSVLVAVSGSTCDALTDIPGLRSLDLEITPGRGTLTVAGPGGQWRIDRDVDDAVLDFPDENSNAFRYVADNAWGAFRDGELVVRDLAVVGNAVIR